MFTIDDFKIGSYSFSWNNRRWNKLIQNDWIKCGEIEIEQHKNIIYIKFLLKVNNL
jgi:hypothetical protein